MMVPQYHRRDDTVTCNEDDGRKNPPDDESWKLEAAPGPGVAPGCKVE